MAISNRYSGGSFDRACPFYLFHVVHAILADVFVAIDGAGPLLLGSGFNWALLGVLSVQIFVYFLAFPNDRLVLKIIVYGVYLMEVLQSILIARDAFVIFVRGMGNIDSTYTVNTLWLSVPVLTGLVTFICQALFAYRIWILSKGRLALRVAFILIVIGCFIQITSAIVLAVALKVVGRLDLAERAPDFPIISGTWYCSSSFGDLLIAVCMIYLSSQQAANTPDGVSNHTRTILHSIVRMTVGTAAATAVIAILTLLLTVVGPVYPTYYQTSLGILGKMYSNSMMVLLNNRLQISSSDVDLKQWMNTTTDTERFQLSDLRFTPTTTTE